MNRPDGIPIAYAPDRVELGRVFRIVLDVPKDQVPVNVSPPASVQVEDGAGADQFGVRVLTPQEFLCAQKIVRDTSPWSYTLIRGFLRCLENRRS